MEHADPLLVMGSKEGFMKPWQITCGSAAGRREDSNTGGVKVKEL